MDKQPEEPQGGHYPNRVFPYKDELDCLKNLDTDAFIRLWNSAKPDFTKIESSLVMYYGTGTVESTDEFEEAYSGARFPHSLGIHFIKEATEFIDKNKTDFTNDLIF